MIRALAWMVLGLCACAIDLSALPVPRIRAIPTSIPEGDRYGTEVTLDARASGDDFAPSPMGLTYAWRLEDSARLGESLQDPVIRVRFAGDHPPLVRLTVRAPDGREAAASYRVALTARP